MLQSATRKLFGLIFSLVVFAFNATALEGEHDCEEQSAVFAKEYADLLNQRDYDALAELLFVWEQECGMSEPLFRARALQLIAGGAFPGVLEQQDMLDHAIAFEIRYNLIETREPLQREEYFELYGDYFGYVPVNESFDRETQRWARQLKYDVPEQSMAYLFLELYSGQTSDFFTTLKAGAFPQSRLSREYYQRVAYFEQKPELSLGVGPGLWMPFSDLGSIGIKPSLGIQIGARTHRMWYDAVFEFRFGKTREEVDIPIQDTLSPTRNFQGGYLGVEVTLVLAAFQHFQIEVFAGAGYDVIDLVEDAREPTRHVFATPAIHVGPAYRYIFSNRVWISVKPGYYFLNHKNKGGSSLGGNAINLRVVVGFSDNARKHQNLKRLGF